MDGMNSSTEETQKKITIMASDGKIFKVDESVMVEAEKIKDRFSEKHFNFLGIPSQVLDKIICYCKKHHDAKACVDVTPATENEEIKAFDAHFVDVDENALVDLYMGAAHLRIKSLINLTRQALEGMRPLPVNTERTSLKKEMHVPMPTAFPAKKKRISPGLELRDPCPIEEEATQKDNICLKSCDGVTFKVKISVVAESHRIKDIIEGAKHAVSLIHIPIPSKILVKAIDYCELVAAARKDSEEVTLAADEDIKAFIAALDDVYLEDLMDVAWKMNIGGGSLFDLLRLNMRERIFGKIPEAAIPRMLGIPPFPGPDVKMRC